MLRSEMLILFFNAINYVSRFEATDIFRISTTRYEIIVEYGTRGKRSQRKKKKQNQQLSCHVLLAELQLFLYLLLHSKAKHVIFYSFYRRDTHLLYIMLAILISNSFSNPKTNFFLFVSFFL